jgi:pimeloyl-ACP methyl ester carboxylesterase
VIPEGNWSLGESFGGTTTSIGGYGSFGETTNQTDTVPFSDNHGNQQYYSTESNFIMQAPVETFGPASMSKQLNGIYDWTLTWIGTTPPPSYQWFKVVGYSEIFEVYADNQYSNDYPFADYTQYEHDTWSDPVVATSNGLNSGKTPGEDYLCTGTHYVKLQVTNGKAGFKYRLNLAVNGGAVADRDYSSAQVWYSASITPVTQAPASLNLWDAAYSWSTHLDFSDSNIGNITAQQIVAQQETTPFKPVVGAVADNASRVLLEYLSPLPTSVTFKITSGPGSIYNTTWGPVYIDSGIYAGYYASFAVYTVPDVLAAFGSGGTMTNTVKFDATDGTNDETQTLTLGRPPVVLVHGLNGNAGEWNTGSGVQASLSGAGFQVSPVDYSATNHSSIETNKDVLLENDRGILKIEDTYHAQEWAIARVDVVGHSMGGLISRYFASQPEYLSVDNYYKGYIHRLVTIGTPHLGAGQPQAYYGFYLECLYEQNPTALAFLKLANFIGMRPGLAYRDLSPLSAASSRFANPASGPVPGYAEVGSAGSWGWVVSWLIDSYINKDASAGPNMQKQQSNWVWLNGSVWNNYQSSDACVSQDSQMGGLPPSWITTTSSLRHAASVPAPLTAEERSNTVGTDIVNQFFADNFAPGGFPCPPAGDPNDNVVIPPALPAFDPFPPLQVDLHGLSYPPSTTVPSISMQNDITSVPEASVSAPSPGQVFAPGDTITVSLAPNNANSLSSAIVAVAQADGTLIGTASITAAPFTATFTIPQTTVGNVNIAAATWDTADNVAESNITIVVQTSATVQSLTPSPVTATFTGVGQTRQLQVTGVFSDTVSRDITSYQTIYSSADSSIAIVSSTGLITAVANGTTEITVTSGSATSVVPVFVSLQAPVVVAVGPKSATPGQVVSLRLNGKNLGGTPSINFLTPAGTPDPNISVSNVAVSPDGYTLTANVTISASCPPETDTIVVTAAGGSSDALAPASAAGFTVN